MSDYRVLVGDCRGTLKTLPDQSINTCVTSPPYFGLRDYGQENQIGLEETPDEYVAALVAVFREVRRVLRDDGTVWLNLGDSYATGGKGGGGSFMAERKDGSWQSRSKVNGWRSAPPGLKHKDIVGIPWRVAFALQADGWYLRQDIIWSKPNPMPESVTDRCTKAHEYIFLLSKSAKYYYDHEAVKEPAKAWTSRAATFDRSRNGVAAHVIPGQAAAQHRPRPSKKRGEFAGKTEAMASTGQNAFRAVVPERNKRSVWTVPSRPYAGAHFATFPPELIKPCILAGCPEGGTVLDIFGGSGTTAGVSVGNGRDAVICELSPDYVELIPGRVKEVSTAYLDQRDAEKQIDWLEASA